jgi:hypothetical protein
MSGKPTNRALTRESPNSLTRYKCKIDRRSDFSEALMPCDLERVYGKLAADLPEDSNNDERFLLDETTIPAAPAELASDRLIINKALYQRLPGCRGDKLDIVAPRSTFRHLGLLALAVLFHEECDRAVIHTTNPESRVKHVVVEHKHWQKTQVGGFRVRPWVLGYVADDAELSYSTDHIGFSAALLRLTNLADHQADEHDWQARDTLWGFGGTSATAELAQYLLNVGRNSAKSGTYVIPANKDFFAAEVQLWVPEAWDVLQRTLQRNNRLSPD